MIHNIYNILIWKENLYNSCSWKTNECILHMRVDHMTINIALASNMRYIFCWIIFFFVGMILVGSPKEVWQHTQRSILKLGNCLVTIVTFSKCLTYHFFAYQLTGRKELMWTSFFPWDVSYMTLLLHPTTSCFQIPQLSFAYMYNKRKQQLLITCKITIMCL
jgi:hypothetical protein